MKNKILKYITPFSISFILQIWYFVLCVKRDLATFFIILPALFLLYSFLFMIETLSIRPHYTKIQLYLIEIFILIFVYTFFSE